MKNNGIPGLIKVIDILSVSTILLINSYTHSIQGKGNHHAKSRIIPFHETITGRIIRPEVCFYPDPDCNAVGNSML